MADRLVILAPAKVNLYLGVGPVRGDGFHEVTTVLQAVDLSDEVVMEAAQELSLTCVPDLGVADAENLAYRAAEAFAAACGRDAAVAITLTKRIPAGAGLGGGSSDAAAVIRGLARMWGVAPSDPRLAETAAALGADVPFFLGATCALMSGRGDVPERELHAPVLDMVVVWPRLPMSTAEAYRAFDAAPPDARPAADTLVAALEGGDPREIAARVHNDMTAASSGLVPAIADVIGFVGSFEGIAGAAMCGSGSAVFGIAESEAAAERCAEAARGRGWWAESTLSMGGRGSGAEGTDG